MSLYDEASLIAYPSGYKESKIYAQKPIDGSGDLTFTRASSGTRVNEQGLIETASTLGSELVTNGDFATNTDWAISDPSTMSISGGKAIFASTPANKLLTSINILAMTVGKSYVVEYTVSDYVIGGVYLQRPNDTSSDVSSANGTYKFTLVATTTSVRLRTFSASNTFKIDNVSVKEYTTANIPRIDYTNGCGQLLLEGQRTNNCLHSNDFTDGGWLKTEVAVSTSTTSPMSGEDATTLTDTAINSRHSVRRINIVNSDSTWSWSLIVKQGTKRYAVIGRYSAAVSNDFALIFDTQNGVYTTTTTPSITTLNDPIDYGNGWWRIGFTTQANPGAWDNFTIGISNGSTYADATYLGDGSGTIHIAAAQVELGSYPTSYIPTSGTTVTRLQDTSITTGLSSVINSVEGVLFAEMAALANDSTNRYISINDGTSTNRIIFKFGTSSNNIAALGLGTVSSFSLSYSGATITNMNKIALKYKANDCALWVNGVEVATDSTFTAYLASTLTNISLSNNGGGGQWLEANIQDLMLFPTALTDEQLTDLTGTVHTSFNSLALSLGYTIV